MNTFPKEKTVLIITLIEDQRKAYKEKDCYKLNVTE